MDDPMMSAEDIEKAKIRTANLEKLLAYWQQQQRDAEMRVLVFAHEASRIQEELFITKMMIDMDTISKDLTETVSAVAAMVTEKDTPKKEPDPVKEPEDGAAAS